MKNNQELVTWVKSKLGQPYCYGTFGQIWTQDLLTAKTRQYPSHYDPSRTAEYKRRIGKQVFDCVGLIKGFLWWDGKSVRYNAAQDVSANGMLGKCKEKGAIADIPELPGVLVFLDGHVGIYLGGGEVVEARGFAYGVVKTKLKERPWKSWGKCPWIDYTLPVAAKTANPIAEKPADAKSTEKKPAEIKAGSLVKFTGGYHYKSADAAQPTGGKRKAGQAKVTLLAKGQRHPYHIIPNGKQSTDAYGWVDAGTIASL